MLIDLRSQFRTPLQRGLYDAVGPWLEQGLGLKAFERVYRQTQVDYQKHPQGGSTFAWFDAGLKALNTSYDVDLPTGFEIPKTGPLVIVANHPFGILDPCVLAHFIATYRPDMRLMANSLLDNIPELQDRIIAVDPFGQEGAKRKNLGAMKEAMRFLHEGGALAVFPAGEVAHYQPGRGIEEAPWSRHIGSLIRHTQASVLPLFFPGSNSSLFHAAGLIHPRFRTGLLLHEMSRRQGSHITLRAGHVIPYGKIKKFSDDEALTRYLRLHTLILANRRKASPEPAVLNSAEVPRTAKSEVYVGARERILREVTTLREQGKCLVSQGTLSVFCAKSAEIPTLLQEIGRQREITFQQVGEGTGKEIDLDKFDSYYEQLFLWDDEKQMLAGGYRLGRADQILQEHGPKGLYTNTLFKFEKPFLASLDQAVEMGRSFITKPYQRHLASLPLLWKGIALWMAKNPHYTKLFGPVSISKDYDSLSRKMMVEFLQDNCLHQDLASYVRPRQPFRYMRSRRMMREFISSRLQDVDDCSALISSVETDGKGLPILLKHYLRLNGTLLSFNVDKSFSSVIDGLILVDLRETEPRLLAKYMGEDAARQYLQHHGLTLARESGEA